jgi:hypothetical protein
MTLPALVGLLLAAQTQPDNPVDPDLLRIARIRVHMSENLTRLPNYTCTQTIERSRRQARSRRFELQDTLRLEVALVEGKELFSWPGSGKFEDKELRDLIGGGGTFGNGDFAIHARSVFLSTVPTYHYEGVVEEKGRRLFRYSYRVPQMLSGYRVRVAENEAIVGYHGYFLVDAATLDLVALEVITDDIPPHLMLDSTSSLMHYARVPIGGSTFLLPQSSVLTVRDLQGGESRNHIQFSSCRQYATESFLSFADPTPEAAPAPAPPPPRMVELPEGLTLDLRLQTPIRLDASATGDELTAVLGSNVKHRGQIILPKGTLIRGRLLRMNKYFNRTEIFNVSLQFTRFEYPGAFGDLNAVLEDAGPSISPNARAMVLAPPADYPGQSTISLRGNRLELGKGFRMLWRTQSKSSGNRQ